MRIGGISPSKVEGTGHDPVVDAYFALRPKQAIRKAGKGHAVVQERGYSKHSILLVSGWAALSKSMSEGGIQIIDVMLPGDVALIGADIAPVAAFTIEALTGISYIAIPLEHINGPELQHAQFRRLLVAMLITAQARMSELLLRMGRSSATCRLAYALLELYIRLERMGLARNGCFHLPLNQHKIGEFAGLSNVHVCRTMRRFERNGLITHLNKHDIRLNDLPSLSALAEINLASFREEILLRRPQ